MALVSRRIKKSGLSATILIVDDEDLVRKIIDRMLQPMGYCILHAADGNEALTICDQWKGAIHLMVTDVMMPGMSGIDLVDCATERWPSIKVLFTTGFASDAAMRRKTSNHPILSKPFTCDQLTGKVQELLSDQPDTSLVRASQSRVQ